MDYQPVDRVPNYEAGYWGQTKDRWIRECLNEFDLHWDWWIGEEFFQMDAREFILVDNGMMPAFPYELLERTDEYEIFRDMTGRVRKVLIEGATSTSRACMDEYISFAVVDKNDFRALKKRYQASLSARYPAQWEILRLPHWKNRIHLLILGQNCSTCGFYWLAREWTGTVNLSYAWYDQPALLHEMMEFIADFNIEVSTPVLQKTDVDYVMISEDLAMKNGPLLSPAHYKEFIFPHMRRMVDFLNATVCAT